MLYSRILGAYWAFILFSIAAFGSDAVSVGSKNFTENHILAEIFSQLLESKGYKIKRNFGMAGSIVTFEALKTGAIDLYPEYTGTISLNILNAAQDMSVEKINEGLQLYNVQILSPLGFNNTYALAVPRALADKEGLQNISDLKKKNYKAAFSYEFYKRKDGWEALKNSYGFDLDVMPMEHALSYEALLSGAAEVMVVYSTDAKIAKYNLKVLRDDKSFFSQYFAVPIVKIQLDSKIKELIHSLAGKINDRRMTQLNAQVELEKRSFATVAREFLESEGLIPIGLENEGVKSKAAYLFHLFLEHLALTFIPIILAIFFALPLAVGLLKWPRLAKVIISAVGLLQTVPSLALLVFMIWAFGMVGVFPAMAALFLYSLLPILRNAYTGLNHIDPILLKAARGIGLFEHEILWALRIPLGLPVIFSGIRVASVINVGMATIAAFIGAGGFGEPIVTGLALNDTGLILQGAIPSALLAIVLEVAFEKLEKKYNPVY